MRDNRSSNEKLGVLLALACGALIGCQQNALEGSIDSDLSIDFSSVKLLKQDHYLLIEYLRESKQGTEKVLKAVIETNHLELPDSGSFDLEGDLFLQHVELQRSTFVGDTFPALDRGSMHFEPLEFRHAGYAHGSFDFFFVNTRRLKGWFDGIIEEI